MLDFRISLIDRIRGFSFGFGFKNVGSFQGLDRGLTSDVGFWFFFGYFESIIDHTNTTNIQFDRSRSKSIIA
jgi:hypothetical protein